MSEFNTVVRVGKSWLRKETMSVAFIGESVKECERWIKDNLKKDEHAYIDYMPEGGLK